MKFNSRSRAINYFFVKPSLYMTIMGGIVVVLTTLLVVEYRSFRTQTNKMLELQEEYRNHIIAINRIMQAAEESTKKKNELTSTQESTENTCPMVNRELEYLKQSTISFFKKENLNTMLPGVQHAWKDYTDQVLEVGQKPKGSKKPPRSKTRRSRAATYAQDEANQFAEPQKIDISFVWPINRSEFWLSSFYGPRKLSDGSRRFHYGIDMAAVRGTPVHAAAGGVVVEARQGAGYGKTIVIAHNGKYRTRYAHLDKILTKVGKRVEKGQIIGKVGATGNVIKKRGRDGSHLHFEVSVFGKRVNPMYFLA